MSNNPFQVRYDAEFSERVAFISSQDGFLNIDCPEALLLANILLKAIQDATLPLDNPSYEVLIKEKAARKRVKKNATYFIFRDERFEPCSLRWIATHLSESPEEFVDLVRERTRYLMDADLISANGRGWKSIPKSLG